MYFTQKIAVLLLSIFKYYNLVPSLFVFFRNLSSDFSLLFLFRNLSSDFSIIRPYVTFSNDSTSAKWLNFHLSHRDRIKIELKTTNGALNSIVNETDTYVVDLTPPALQYLGDGLTQEQDIDFQVKYFLLTSKT